MSSRRMVGYWIVIGAITVTVAILAWFFGDALYPSPVTRVLAVLFVGALLIAMEGLVRAALRWVARADTAKQSTPYTRDPGARTGAQQADAPPATMRWADLRDALRAGLGWRWKYGRPWLLLCGDPKLIEQLCAKDGRPGWCVTDDAVLLWNQPTADGQPDTRWLHQLAKMRRSRPLDAVVVLVDGDANMQDPGSSGLSGLQTARIADALKWAAPVYVVSVDAIFTTDASDVIVTGCEFPDGTDRASVAYALNELRERLADAGIRRLWQDPADLYAVELSRYLDDRVEPLADLLTRQGYSRSRWLRARGAFFASRTFAGNRDRDSFVHVNRALWRYISESANSVHGRRVGLHLHTTLSAIAFTAIGLWSAGMLVSAMNNAHEVMLTRESLQALKRAGDTPERLRTLLALQQRIGLHEARVQEHTPLFTRFGLNHDRAVLDALWTPYAHAARPLLVSPVQQDIEGQLVDLGQMQTAQVDTQSSQMAQDGQQALKTYLMLAEPQRADAAFMTPQLEHHWNLDTGLRPGERLDLSAQLMGFWAQHFPAHPDWRIQPREDLVGNARQTLLAIIGVKNSEDTIYQGILDSVGRKYPVQTLASLTAGTDTRGVFSTSAAVPGVFTRQAWEGSVEAAIDEAAKQNGVTANWVLGNTGSTGNGQAGADAQTPEALRAALRKHYFDDYAEHWQEFMNSIRCAAAPTLPAAVGQLKLIADARQSPLIALMKSLAWQGGAGVQQASLSDALVTKAQNFFGKKDDAPQNTQAIQAGPLDASFGPVVKLVGQAGISSNAAPAAGSDLSMERFTERVMTLRLKLQQISDSADSDDRARQVAQALYQGKGSDLSDTLAYAKLIAASLGEQWAGMGNALFVEPVTQATRTVLAPAQASLNDAWRETIVAAWNRSFAGRYPFANTTNDASLPELARFLRPQAGLIDNFLSTQLAGALQLQGDQWVATSGGAGVGSTAIAFDPAFLKAINTLQQVAGHLLAQGEPQYVFSIKPVPTPGVADTLLTLDGQTLHYYNQVETWSTMTWPSGEPQKAGTRLEWQTDTAGTNKNFEFGGRWALLRMLERARVEPVDSATYQLTWQTKPADTDSKPAATTVEALTDLAAQVPQEPLAPAPAGMTHPLRYLIRTDVGRGPLELLALRGFTLPSRIFIDRSTTSAARPAVSAGPPPLPKAAIAAAKQAAVSLPAGIAP
ncbi:ImcF-related family protein [Paraburkholderia bannensis]|uniref:ImcF-related family protein n=1 Tax=Paraburkholderia bannensis TaxID=765414 RepID=UPI002ABE4EB9|nr:ImcF-related family protein [Paraburkholderia bannensis]